MDILKSLVANKKFSIAYNGEEYDFYARSLTVNEKLKLEAMFKNEDTHGQAVKYLVVHSVVDEDGNQLLTDETVGDIDSKLFEALSEAVLDISSEEVEKISVKK